MTLLQAIRVEPAEIVFRADHQTLKMFAEFIQRTALDEVCVHWAGSSHSTQKLSLQEKLNAFGSSRNRPFWPFCMTI